MPERHPIIAVRLLACLISATALLVGCFRYPDNSPPRPSPPEKVEEEEVAPLPPGVAPLRPLTIAEPTAPSRFFASEDLAVLEEKNLLAMAAELARQRHWQSAAQWQYWAVQKSHRNQYDLACYLAQCEQPDAAFFWLQTAALADGVDAAWAERDADLTILRRDPRWQAVAVFLRQCEEFWATQIRGPTTTLIVPKNYDGQTPLTTIVGLHANGSRPEAMIDDRYQRFADQLNVAFVGVSGTIARGKDKFVWSEKPETDHNRIRQALDSLATRLTVKTGHVIALGFAEGAQVGLEATARRPEFYLGAIVLSPTCLRGSQLEKALVSPYLAKRRFVFVSGDKEEQANKILADRDRLWAQQMNARVIVRLTPDQTEKGLPPDFAERLPEWVRFIEDAAIK